MAQMFKAVGAEVDIQAWEQIATFSYSLLYSVPLQIGGMIVHRATTFLHIIATTKLPCERADNAGNNEMEKILAKLQRNYASGV